MADMWHWEVTYQDGSTLAEYDADGHDHGWAEVQAGVSQIKLVPQVAGVPEHILHVPPGYTPRVFRRRTIRLLGPGEPPPSVTCLALETAPSVGLFLFLWPDGRMLLTDDFQAV